MTRSPLSIIEKSAIARPTWRCRRFVELGDLDRELPARRGAVLARDVGGDGGGRRDHDSYNAAVHEGLDDSSVSAALARLDRRGHRPRRRLDPVQPLHGARPVRARARLLRERATDRRPHAGIGQRLRHRARALAALRPRPRAPARAGARRERQRRGLGVRRRQRARSRPSCWQRSASGCGATRSSSCRRRCASASARRPARSATASAGSTRCPDADDRRRRRQRGARRDAGRPAPLRRHGVAGARRRRAAKAPAFAWADRPTPARPPVDVAFPAGSTTELHAQARAFVATLADRLERGAIFLVDYGFPEDEYYHPQRSGGTLMCHRAHRADTDPLVDVGLKDITAAPRLHARSRSPARTPASTSSATPRRRASSSTAASAS